MKLKKVRKNKISGYYGYDNNPSVQTSTSGYDNGSYSQIPVVDEYYPSTLLTVITKQYGIDPGLVAEIFGNFGNKDSSIKDSIDDIAIGVLLNLAVVREEVNKIYGSLKKDQFGTAEKMAIISA